MNELQNSFIEWNQAIFYCYDAALLFSNCIDNRLLYGHLNYIAIARLLYIVSIIFIDISLELTFIAKNSWNIAIWFEEISKKKYDFWFQVFHHSQCDIQVEFYDLCADRILYHFSNFYLLPSLFKWSVESMCKCSAVFIDFQSPDAFKEQISIIKHRYFINFIRNCLRLMAMCSFRTSSHLYSLPQFVKGYTSEILWKWPKITNRFVMLTITQNITRP